MAAPTIWTNSAPSDLAKRELVYQRNANDPTLSTPNMGTTPAYTNPSTVSGINPTFGKSDQFNIPSTLTPFPFTQQRAENQNYLTGFTEFLKSQEKLPAIQQRYENRFGIPDLQETYLRNKEAADMVGNQIQNLPESVKGASAESMLTQGQLDRVVNKQAKELLTVYNNLSRITEQVGTRLAIAEQNLNDAAKLEVAQQQKEMTPWLQSYELMNVMQAREFTGWTFANQLELQRLISNQQAGLQWTDAEATRAHQLAMQENEFENQVKLLEKQNEFALDLWG